MPRRPRNDKRKYEALSLPQLWELLCGPRSDDPARWAFANDAERKAAWGIHGAQLTELAAGAVPWAKQEYEG